MPGVVKSGPGVTARTGAGVMVTGLIGWGVLVVSAVLLTLALASGA
jgi:hypothetical protein